MPKRMMRKRLIAAIGTICLLAGCTMGQNYHRPAITSPVAFRGGGDVPAADPASLADLKWFEVFNDERLQEMIRTALVQSYDIRDAVVRVEAARANLGITRADQFPTIEAGAGVTSGRTSASGSVRLPEDVERTRTFGVVGLNLALVRGGRVGAAAPRDRSRSGRPARQRSQPQGGDDDARQRRRRRLLQPARAWTRSWRSRSAR